ncbi:DUF4339 domain-containing protein [Rubinisphaera italica]|uniref:GYF domain-containing protein n=1 Tax=Rubinisphaera italica TaxID=2527969 RepID=A0A5C5XBC7_9PLAN|nr:DUF4339 domain-containing protein [Rubinisphaera italica]TWT59711.1 hypothetical protein Pan54_04210 [Rubinisphaera italica]
MSESHSAHPPEPQSPEPPVLPKQDWWLARNGQSEGPYSSAYIELQLASGTIKPRDLICQVGEQHWQPISTVSAFQAAHPAADPTKSPPLPPTIESSLNNYALRYARRGYGILLAASIVLTVWEITFHEHLTGFNWLFLFLELIIYFISGGIFVWLQRAVARCESEPQTGLRFIQFGFIADMINSVFFGLVIGGLLLIIPSDAPELIPEVITSPLYDIMFVFRVFLAFLAFCFELVWVIYFQITATYKSSPR